MSDEEDSEEGYDIGYGKPPKHTRWQKGQSGNPTGKKKKEQSPLDLLKKLYAKEIVVQQNGVNVTMTQGEVMLAATFHKGMNADLGTVKFITQTLGTGEAGLSGAKAPALTKDMLNVLETHADWVGIVEAARSDLDEANGNQEDGDDDDDTY